jgi:hypothetical protein
MKTNKRKGNKNHNNLGYFGGCAGAKPCFEVDLIRVVDELLNLELFTEF